ncbi:MAG: glycoside hydrolase family 95 protein [Devosia sp.]|uniref:glycoside hydrolase family 95 protein n=1 Tax=Devosia sp. TaxID=1871048 RepID=UPI00261B95A5|nr:glycoside hydrolase family 95 protein [Devosia sp.]MDB5539307.1 glycoside hydrolase family 95 protein [Devosia sp.]
MPRYCLDLDTPAQGFIDSFLLGNGWLGATVRGGVGTERFDLNLDTVWSGGPLEPETGEVPARLLPELRAAIRAGDFLHADELGRQLQGQRYTQSYQPLGGLELTYAEGPATTYTRRLDLAEATTITRYDTGRGPAELTSFVSYPDGVLVATATEQGVLTPDHARLAFASPHPGADISTTEIDGLRWLIATARVPSSVVPNYVPSQQPVTYSDTPPAADGTVATGMGYAVVAALAPDPAGGLRLIASAASGFRGYDQRPSADFASLIATARQRVTAAMARTTEALRQRHRDDYRAYFDRTDLDLGPANARAELLFHFGRYLLISSSRPGTEATNLQGIWNTDLRPAWSANYTININTQMNYWPAEPTGLADLHQPMFTLTRDLARAGAATARRYYDAVGATAHHNADLWRHTAPVPGHPQWSNWPSALYWMAAHLLQHLDYGAADPAFAAEYALPIFRAAAGFALDILVEDATGALVASPSTSPEHSFVVAGQHVAITQGTAMDQELIRETLATFLALAEPADPLAGPARAALSRLREPLIAPDGVLLEWDDDKEPAELGHRHLSHLYGLYPGNRITRSGTPEAFEAVRRALNRRLENGTGYTGWSRAWVVCLAARLHDAELAEQSVAGLLDHLTSRSLLVLHPHADWPGGNVFQIDGNFGVTAGIAEMLVQSHANELHLLPALPTTWPTGNLRGLRARGGLTVDLEWHEGALTRVMLSSTTAQTITLRYAGETHPVAVSPTPAEWLPGTPAASR